MQRINNINNLLNLVIDSSPPNKPLPQIPSIPSNRVLPSPPKNISPKLLNLCNVMDEWISDKELNTDKLEFDDYRELIKYLKKIEVSNLEKWIATNSEMLGLKNSNGQLKFLDLLKKVEIENRGDIRTCLDLLDIKIPENHDYNKRMLIGNGLCTKYIKKWFYDKDITHDTWNYIKYIALINDANKMEFTDVYKKDNIDSCLILNSIKIPEKPSDNELLLLENDLRKKYIKNWFSDNSIDNNNFNYDIYNKLINDVIKYGNDMYMGSVFEQKQINEYLKSKNITIPTS